MKTIWRNILVLAGTVSLSSCWIRGDVKPLVGGIRSSSAAMEAQGDVAYADEEADACAVGLEIPAAMDCVPEQILKRVGYTTSYNKDTKLPNWVAWSLTAEHTEGSAKRPNKAFHEDEEVEEPRATDDDYYNKGYDRGHMCPAADNKWSEEAMTQSFLFTNICPQNHGLNAGDWNEMENQCRAWAKKYGCVYIVCGPILYNSRHKTIGKKKVVVPEAFYKVVLRMKPDPAAIGFVYKNMPGNRPKGDYVNSVDQIERITGIDFFPSLPDDIENKIEAEADIDEW